MKIKIFLISILLISVFCFSSIALAQTMTEAQRQSLIAQFQTQIAQLQQQIVQMQQEQQGNTSTSASWCYTFNNNLGYAQSGTSEIASLHTALQKEAIAYGSDDLYTYSTGTVEAIKQFQKKYKVKANTAGYVGATTRDKLNELYECNKDCKPNWKSEAWSICTNSKQTRIVTDLNNCGKTTNKPKTEQSCKVKPIDINVDGSDGPVNIFLTIGNGALINGSVIGLSSNVVLQWTGNNVSSCTASDTLTPKIFSGYKASSGSYTVNLSGDITGASSSDKVSGTFKVTCVSTTTGAKVSDSITVNLYYNANANCNPNWQCATWGACTSGKQARTCVDLNGCLSLAGKPALTQSCIGCVPNWLTPGPWTTCVNGKQTRMVADQNNCGTTTNKPATSQSCCSAECLNQSGEIWAINCSGTLTKCTSGKICQLTHSASTSYSGGVLQTTQTLTGAQCVTLVCIPGWTYTNWSACIDGKRTRTAEDSSKCGVTTGREALSETCCSAVCLTQDNITYAISCSGSVTKCAADRTCRETYSTTTSLVNGVVQTTQKLTGTQCVLP
ncbi:MAG: peptidoglycan-binding domain-containing protein [Candidatus Staskawiczbacteria bacterium]|jgi:hypothetical protein